MRRCTCVSAHAASSMRVHGVLRIFVVALSFATGVAFAFPPSQRTAQLVRRGSAPHPRPRAVPVVAQFSIWRHPANWLGPDRHTLKVCALQSYLTLAPGEPPRPAACAYMTLPITRRTQPRPPSPVSQRDRLDHPRPCPTDARTETQKCRTGQTGRETGVLRVFGFCARLASYAQSLRQSSSFPINSSSFVAPALGPNSEELQGSEQGSVHVYGTGVFVKVAPCAQEDAPSGAAPASRAVLGCSGPLTGIYARGRSKGPSFFGYSRVCSPIID